MAYFIHNKYDKASIDALAAIDQTANTVIDYYGDYETYKYLDTAAGFGILYDTLSYVTPGAVIHGGQSDKDNSHFNFQSSIVIKSIQRGVCIGTGTSVTTDLTINISKIDASKSFVIINGSYSYNSRLVSLNDNSVTFYTKHTSSPGEADKMSYQIIEYC